MNKHLKTAILGYIGKSVKLDLDLKAEEMLASLCGNNSQGYGARIPKFIIENTTLTLSSPAKGEGDAIIYSKSHKYCLVEDEYYEELIRKLIEIKVSVCDIKTNSTFSIVRIKPREKLDYYIVCLVDLVIPEGEDKPVNVIGYFYLLPASYIEKSSDFKTTTAMGTKEVNEGNPDAELRFTIEKEDAFEKFGKYNLSRGTSFIDLKEAIDYLNNGKVAPKPSKIKKKKETTSV
jgi:hypothetical protein